VFRQEIIYNNFYKYAIPIYKKIKEIFA